MPFCEYHEGYASLFMIVSADNLRDSSIKHIGVPVLSSLATCDIQRELTVSS